MSTLAGYCPERIFQSAALMLAAWMSTSTSPAAGTGSGSSPYSRTSGPPNLRKKQAFRSRLSCIGPIDRYQPVFRLFIRLPRCHIVGMKNVLTIHRQGEGHWVGDGFPVHTVFHYQERPELSPFLLLDHAGPADFAPSAKQRGVGWHPHRGFETVTVVYDGEVDHHDTAGNGGSIRAGDVQWMTAGSGLLHKEFHSPAFTKNGGRFEVLQLWVNLPAKSKMTAPRYQELVAKSIPVVALEGDAGSVR